MSPPRAILLVALTLLTAFAPPAFAASPPTKASGRDQPPRRAGHRAAPDRPRGRADDPEQGPGDRPRARRPGEPGSRVRRPRAPNSEARTQHQNRHRRRPGRRGGGTQRPGALDVLQVTGQLHIQVSPLGARLTIDGLLTALDARGLVVLTPGVHRIALSHGGYQAHSQDVNIVGGVTASVVVNLAKEPEVVTIVEPQDATPVDFGAMPWIALGLGVALAGVGTYLVVDGTNDWNNEDNYPGRGREAHRPGPRQAHRRLHRHGRGRRAHRDVHHPVLARVPRRWPRLRRRRPARLRADARRRPRDDDLGFLETPRAQWPRDADPEVRCEPRDTCHCPP